MTMNQPQSRSTPRVEGVLDSPVATVLSELLGHEPVGLLAAGIDPAALVLALLGNTQADANELFAGDVSFAFPEAAKRKAVDEDEEDDEDDEADDDDDVADEDEDEDEVDDDEDLDEDEDEDEEDDDDEDEEDDEFDDPDDDDDFDDDDDDDDFDDDE